MIKIQVLTGGTIVPNKARIISLVQQLFGSERIVDGRWIRKTLSNKNTFVFGASKDKELVGIAVGNIKTHFTGMELYIDDVVVREDVRGQGIGTRLIHELERYAETRNCSAVMFAGAHEEVGRLCHSLGYETRKAVFEKGL